MAIALALSGGIGSRIKSDVPKQYVTVMGKMIITYTLEALCAHEMIDGIRVVADSAWHDAILADFPDKDKFLGFSAPGKNRQLSILNGLRDIRKSADDNETVLIHDVARPLVSADLLSRTISAVGEYDGAVPTLPLKDTVYLSEDGTSLTGLLDRSKILAGQAPEAFLLGKYTDANEALSADEIMKVSGSAQPAMMAGLSIAAICGDEQNFKITTDEDMTRFIRIVGERQ